VNKDYLVVFVTPEIMIPEFGEPACGANFRGGLGILAGDIMEGLAKKNIKALGIAPFYDLHWMTREKISYENTPAKPLFKLKVGFNGKAKMVGVMKMERAGLELFGIQSPEIFDTLYTADRWQRLQQEVLIGNAVPSLLKKLGVRPDIIWLQEGHTAVCIPATKGDPYFEGTKFLFTTHTPAPEGMEKFHGNWICELGVDANLYHQIFLKDGLIDMTGAAMILADRVTAVSQEHCETTQKIFPEFAQKITGITNGSSFKLWTSPRVKAARKAADRLRFWEAHQEDKAELIKFIFEKSGKEFSLKKPQMGWVRRLAWYKNQLPMMAPVIKAICAEKGTVTETSYGPLEGLGIQVFCSGRAHESDSGCLGWMAEFERWTRDELADRFVFLPQYDLKTLKLSVQGCDIWFSSPMPGWEACGQSDQRAAFNANVNLSTYGGGAREHIKEYNPVTGEGSGFFIEPYDPRTVYNKLKIISDLYYAWVNAGDSRWLNLRMNSFEESKALSALNMIDCYEKIFQKLLASKTS